MKTLGYILFFILITPASVIYSGFTVSTLWGWFIVPSLGVAELSLPVAIGGSLLLRFITYQPPVNEAEGELDEQLLRFSLYAVIFPSMALFMGWITTMFM